MTTSHSYNEFDTKSTSVSTTLLNPTPKILLVPVATPGSGKTVLLTILLKLFNCGYVENDSCQNKQDFHDKIVDNLSRHNLVLVDRNNHLGILREEVATVVLSEYPETIIISIRWCHSETDDSSDKIFESTYRNILRRGVHHPGLTAFHTSSLEKIVESFISRFEPVDPVKYPSDINFSHNFVIYFDKPLPEQLFERILPALKSLLVSPESYSFPENTSIPELENILSQVLNDLTKVKYTRDVVELPSSLNQVSILLGGNIMKDLQDQLFSEDAVNLFPESTLSEAKTFLQQLNSDPSQELIFSPGHYQVILSNIGDLKSEVQNFYLSDIWSNWIGAGVQVYFDKLIWRHDKIMVLSVSSIHTVNNSSYNSRKSSDTSIPIHTSISICNILPCSQPTSCSNCRNLFSKGLYSSIKYLHVTVGLLNESIPLAQSNILLEAFYTKNNSEFNPRVLHFNPPLVALGRVIVQG